MGVPDLSSLCAVLNSLVLTSSLQHSLGRCPTSWTQDPMPIGFCQRPEWPEDKTIMGKSSSGRDPRQLCSQTCKASPSKNFGNQIFTSYNSGSVY